MASVTRAPSFNPLWLRSCLTNSSLPPCSCLVSSFISVSVLSTRYQTPVCKRTLNPVYAAKDATFDFPIYLSLADKLGVLEFVVWDKDMLRKEYMGEHALPLDEWFKGNAFAFDDSDNEASLLCDRNITSGEITCLYPQPFSVNVVSSRATTNASGTMHIKVGFVHPPNRTSPLEFEEVYQSLVKHSRPSLVSLLPVRVCDRPSDMSPKAYITDSRHRHNPLPPKRARVRR